MSERLRVVFDINVWVNGVIGPKSTYPFLPQVPPTGLNPSADCMSLAFDRDRFSVFVSPHILNNTARVFKLAGLNPKAVERITQDMVEMVHLSQGSVVDPPREALNQRDHGDNLLLDLLLATNSDVLVTCDGELLQVNGWKGRAILHPAAFVKLALTIRPS